MTVFRRITAGLLLGLILILGPWYLAEAAPLAQSGAGQPDGQAIFQTKCASCHTIGGGRLVGPDLEGVTGRRDPDWLAGFIQAPDQMIADGDPTALQLLEENNNVPMPNLALTDADVAAVLAYLGDPQGAGQAQPAPAAALPAGSVENGRKLFSGEVPLEMGGTSCNACHTVSGSGALGGGALGPDLTHAVARLSEAGLASSLANIVYPTMQGPFLNRPLSAQEQADLVAYLKWADQNAPAVQTQTLWWFTGLGLAGALLLFAGMLFFWPRQRQSRSERLRKTGAARRQAPLTPSKSRPGKAAGQGQS